MAITPKKVGIVGISGYSGCIALEILLGHKGVTVTYVSANNTQGAVADIWPQLKGKTDLVCSKFDLNTATKLCDLVFLAVPHTVSLKITPQLLEKGVRVIDLSGDYRLQDTASYEKWYGAKHSDPKNLANAVYGLPELFREKIKKAKLVSNPGCYPTAALLGLLPLVTAKTDDIKSIIIDAKSGVSGAGKKKAEDLMATGQKENFKAYKALAHQHTPEIDQFLSKVAEKKIAVEFIPHLLPLDRGILETIYVQLKGTVEIDQVVTLYKKFYKTEPFVRVLPAGEQPELKNVVKTNYCDIGFAVNEKKNLVAVTAAIDNLVKGASGQAVQNMNIMFGFPEKEGL